MSEKLTTRQIIRHIENDAVPAEWAWECAIESAMSDGTRDAVDAARFLESFQPEREWSAAEYHGLMYHHFTGRWPSAAELGVIRAREKLDDGKIGAKRFEEITSSDESAAKWLRSQIGTYVFDCADGTVLSFDGIFGGVIDEEDPVA